MTKKELAREISISMNVETDIAEAFLDHYIKCSRKALGQGQSIYLRGFGTFTNVVRKEKKARVITRNETVLVPAMRRTKFVASDRLENLVKALPL